MRPVPNGGKKLGWHEDVCNVCYGKGWRATHRGRTECRGCNGTGKKLYPPPVRDDA